MQSRAVIFAEMGKPLLVEQVDYDDEVAPGHALVRNFASGVCHSQLHALHGHTNPTLPMVLGHESTGEVVAVGDGVDHVAPGDKVLVGWLPRNPQPGAGRTVSSAPVRWRGEDLNGHAGIFTWSEHTVANAEFVLKVPNDTPNEVTSIIGCAVMTGSGAVTNSLNVQKGESCAVYGVGGVGLCAIAALAVREADTIIAVDLSDEKLEFAKHFGANVLINARRGQPGRGDPAHHRRRGGLRHRRDRRAGDDGPDHRLREALAVGRAARRGRRDHRIRHRAPGDLDAGDAAG